MPTGGPDSFRRSFQPDVGAATAARLALDDLRPQLDDDLLDRGRLALSEVVTNSVRHARLRPAQLIDVQVTVLVALLRIKVFDDGAGFDPVVTRPDPNSPSAGGWGLWLVDQVTDRWGVDCSHSTRVWLEFDRGPS